MCSTQSITIYGMFCLGNQKTQVQKKFPLTVRTADMHAKGCPFRPVALNHSTAPGSFSCRKRNAKSSMACGSSCEICCANFRAGWDVNFPKRPILQRKTMSLHWNYNLWQTFYRWIISSITHVWARKFQNRLCKTPVEFPSWMISPTVLRCFWFSPSPLTHQHLWNHLSPLLSSTCPTEPYQCHQTLSSQLTYHPVNRILFQCSKITLKCHYPSQLRKPGQTP